MNNLKTVAFKYNYNMAIRKIISRNDIIHCSSLFIFLILAFFLNLNNCSNDILAVDNSRGHAHERIDERKVRSQKMCAPWISLTKIIMILSWMVQLNCVFAVVPQEEIYALNVFYTSTQGDQWIWRSELLEGPKWNFTTNGVNPCNTNGLAWQGIECSRSASLCGGVQTCHITHIILNRYNLLGTLPDELQLLSNLVYFDVEANSIWGTIPEVFGNIVSLEKLDLSNNNIT
jgi:hypothetical protein